MRFSAVKTHQPLGRHLEFLFGGEGSAWLLWVSISSVIDSANTRFSWWCCSRSPGEGGKSLETGGCLPSRFEMARGRGRQSVEERRNEEEGRVVRLVTMSMFASLHRSTLRTVVDWVSSGCTGRMDPCRGYVELVALCGDYLNEPPLISKLSPGPRALSFSPLLPATETSTVSSLRYPGLFPLSIFLVVCVLGFCSIDRRPRCSEGVAAPPLYNRALEFEWTSEGFFYGAELGLKWSTTAELNG